MYVHYMLTLLFGSDPDDIQLIFADFLNLEIAIAKRKMLRIFCPPVKRVLCEKTKERTFQFVKLFEIKILLIF